MTYKVREVIVYSYSTKLLFTERNRHQDSEGGFWTDGLCGAGMSGYYDYVHLTLKSAPI